MADCSLRFIKDSTANETGRRALYHLVTRSGGD
jgi:hypothetical protein